MRKPCNNVALHVIYLRYSIIDVIIIIISLRNRPFIQGKGKVQKRLDFYTATSHHLWDLLKEFICLLGPIRHADIIKTTVAFAILPLPPESFLIKQVIIFFELSSLPLLINFLLSSHAAYSSFLIFSSQKPVVISLCHLDSELSLF